MVEVNIVTIVTCASTATGMEKGENDAMDIRAILKVDKILAHVNIPCRYAAFNNFLPVEGFMCTVLSIVLIIATLRNKQNIKLVNVMVK